MKKKILRLVCLMLFLALIVTTSMAAPTITILSKQAINSTFSPLTANSTFLPYIEYFEINMTLADAVGIDADSWHFNFTANGTASCALGNKQDLRCYNLSNPVDKWIFYMNNTNTSSFDSTISAEGDQIAVTTFGSIATELNLSFRIDEHYNPNVWKEYSAMYNFSDVKFQTGVSQKITKDNYLRINVSQSNIPLDAPEYKLDFRANSSAIAPSDRLEAYGCNISAPTGEPSTTDGCVLMAEKFFSEFQDTTKFRAMFTNNTIDGIGHIAYVILKTDENNQNRFYSLKTLKATEPTHTSVLYYSTDSGTTYTQNTDGYETELNINWFYPDTEFVFQPWCNDTSGNSISLIDSIVWNFGEIANIRPLVDIINPAENTTIPSTYTYTFETSDPNNDDLNVSLWLYTGDDLNETLVTDMNSSNTTFTYTTSIIGDAKIVFQACELDTPEKLCINATHDIFINPCFLTEDYTQTAQVICDELNTSIYKWETRGYSLIVEGATYIPDGGRLRSQGEVNITADTIIDGELNILDGYEFRNDSLQYASFNDVVDGGSLIDLYTNWTVSIDFKIDANLTAHQTLWGFGDAQQNDWLYLIYTKGDIATGNRMKIGSNAKTSGEGSIVQIGEWHNVIVTRNSTDTTGGGEGGYALYLDGVLEYYVTESSTIEYSNIDAFYAGAIQKTAIQEYANATIANLKVYNPDYAHTETNASAIYNNTFTESPVAHFKMKGNFEDFTGTYNDGTPVNSPTARDSLTQLGALVISDTGTADLTSGDTIITNEEEDGNFAIDCDGTLLANKGMVNITTPILTIVDLACTGNLYNLNIDTNTLANDVRLNPDWVIENDMNIISGQVKSGSTRRTLNVSGDVTVFNGALLGDDVVQENKDWYFGSLTINSGGTYYATNASTITTGKNSGFKAIDNDGILFSNGGTFNVTTTINPRLDLVGTSGNVSNLIIDSSILGNTQLSDVNPQWIDGDLLVNDIFNLNSFGFTAIGDVTINSVLDCNLGTNPSSATIEFGSLTINSGGTYNATSGTTIITNETNPDGKAINCEGTLTANSGLFKIITPTVTEVDLFCTGNPYNLEIATGDVANQVRKDSQMHVENYLNITSGFFGSTASKSLLNVSGDVLLYGTLGRAETEPHYFGSLTIESGGTYSATSGTTTITSEDASGDAFENLGTFIANGGTLFIDTNTLTEVDFGSDYFYNLILDSNRADLSGAGGAGGGMVHIAGWLNVTSGAARVNSAALDMINVTGEVVVNGTLGGNVQESDNYFGALTITTNGVYDATTGATTITNGSFDNNGTFTHNDGTFVWDIDNFQKTYNVVGTVPVTFYNLWVKTAGIVGLYTNLTVIDTFTVDARTQWSRLTPSGIIILGNTTNAGHMTGTGGGSFFVTSSGEGKYTGIYGASQLFPALLDKTYHWNYYDDSNLHFKWVNITQDIVTGSKPNTKLTLDGACEFAGITTDADFTFNMSGQRAEFNGDFANMGTFDADGLMVAHGLLNIDAAFLNYDKLTLIATQDGAGQDIQTGTNAIKTVLINTNGAWVTGKPIYAEKFISGAGTFNTNNQVLSVTNKTIATGGTTDAGSSIITISDNWKSSGGLIGLSALDLNGSSPGQFIDMTNTPNLDIPSNGSFGAWFKMDSASGDNGIISRKDGATDGYRLFLDAGTTLKAQVDNGATASAEYVCCNDGKWHNAMATYDGILRLYVDGKLVAVEDGVGSISSTNEFFIGSLEGSTVPSAWMDGEIAQVSVWNVTLSESEIRDIMFKQYADLGDMGANCTGWWQMDEGTGTTVADSTPNGNDGTASDSDVWASGGTFTYDTSTVNMTGDGTIYYREEGSGEAFYNLEVAQPTKTTTIWAPTNTRNLVVLGTLTTGSGTFTDGAQTQDLLISGSSSPIDGGSTFANIYRTNYITGDANITASTYNLLSLITNDRWLLGDVIVNADLTLSTSGKSLISDGYNITTETAIVTGTLNLTAGSSLIFEDTAGAGFSTSTGTFNMLGELGNFVSIMSETEPNPTYIPEINATLLTDHKCQFTNVYTVNSTGGEYIVCGGSINVSAVGFWDFISPTLILTYPLNDNSTVLEYGQNFTLNYSAVDTNLAYMFHNITQSGTEYNSSEISVLGNTTYTREINLTANWALGLFDLEISASDDHNELKFKKSRTNVKQLEIEIGDEKFDKKDTQKLKEADSLTFKKNDKTVLEIKFKGNAKNEVKYAAYQFKMGHCTMTNNDAEIPIELVADNLIYIPDSQYTGHFLYGDNHEFFYEFSDIDAEGISLRVDNNWVYLYKPGWKKNTEECFDPVAGGVNIRTEFYSFNITDTAAPTWNQTPASFSWEYPDALSYTVNASDPFLDTYYISDTTNFKITGNTIENNTLLPLGDYPLTISVNDTSGNILSTPITITIEDTTAPTWNETPADQAWEYGAPFSYEVNASDYFLITYHMDDISNFSIGSETGIIEGTYPNDTTNTPLGNYTLNITAQDASGNNVTAGIKVNYRDTTFPIWVQTPPNILWEFYTSFTTQFNASDLLLDGYWINDTSNFTMDKDTGVMINNTLLKVGNYPLTIYANDTTGNTISQAINITVHDTTEPTWNPEPVDQYVTFGEFLNFSINATDPSGIGIYFINDTTNFQVNNSVFIVNNTGLQKGFYYLTISVNDTYNNINTISIVIDVEGTLATITRITEVTQYEGGENAVFTILLEDEDGESFDGADCTLSIYEGGVTELVADSPMTHLTGSKGLYTYSYSVPNAENDYVWQPKCVAANVTRFEAYQFRSSRGGEDMMMGIMIGLALLAFLMAYISFTIEEEVLKYLLFTFCFIFVVADVAIMAFESTTVATTATTYSLMNISIGLLLFVFIYYMLKLVADIWKKLKQEK